MKEKWMIMIAAAAALSLFFVGFLTASLLHKKTEPKVTVSAAAIEERISQCSKLTTAQLDYRGLIRYTEGEIPFINKKSFSMVYVAHVTAGIDLSKAQVEVNKNHVIITLPAAVMQEVIIDPDTIEFYDETASLFNWAKREDAAKAMEYAKEDAMNKIEESELLAQATAQAETVLRTLLAPVTGDEDAYTLEILTQ